LLKYLTGNISRTMRNKKETMDSPTPNLKDKGEK
jgi:hypothetical protein